MAFSLPGTAKLRVSDRDQVMDEVDRADVGAPNPFPKSGRIQSGMANVEIKPSASATAEVPQMAKRSPRQLPSKTIRGPSKQVEQIARGFSAQDLAKAIVLNDGLCAIAEMLEIGEANAIDAGRITASPVAPDQSRHVDQERGVVGHWPVHTK
jgi:hypothetical protein